MGNEHSNEQVPPPYDGVVDEKKIPVSDQPIPMSEKTKKLKQKEVELTKREENIKQREENINQREENIKQKEDDIKEKRNILIQQEVTFNNKEAVTTKTIKDEEEKLAQKEAALAKEKALLDVKDKEVTQKIQELKTKYESYISNLGMPFDELIKNIKLLHAFFNNLFGEPENYIVYNNQFIIFDKKNKSSMVELYREFDITRIYKSSTNYKQILHNVPGLSKPFFCSVSPASLYVYIDMSVTPSNLLETLTTNACTETQKTNTIVYPRIIYLSKNKTFYDADKGLTPITFFDAENKPAEVSI